MENIILVIQARMGSTRCPGKMLIPIEGIPLIKLVFERASKSTKVNSVVVATTVKDNELARYCRKNQIPVITGPENDVLARFTLAIRKTKADHVVRICGDQPFTDPKIIDTAVTEHLANNADYTSTVLEPTFPKGVDVEVVRAQTLVELEQTTKDPADREHVTLALRKETKYKRHSIRANKDQEGNHLNLCIDTPKDLRYIQAIAHALTPYATTEQIITYAKKIQRKPLIAMRADGGWKQGMGHLATCFDLCEEIKKQTDTDFVFITKNIPEAKEVITKRGYNLVTIPNRIKESKQILEVVNKIRPEVYFIDLLTTKENYAPQLRKLNIKTVNNDILGDTTFEADVIINRSTLTERINHYPISSKTVTGPQYAILNPRFKEEAQRTINYPLQNILLTFGGSDPKKILLKTLKAIDLIEGVNITAVIGSAYKHQKQLEKLITKLKKSVHFVTDVRDMKELYITNDLVLASGGRTLYELACTGTPAIIICAEEHQMTNAREFEECIINLGMTSQVSEGDIRDTISRLTKDQLINMSENGRKLVDGKGVERVAKIIVDLL